MTKEKLKLGSLFDGIGGWLIAAERNDIEPVWASEIAQFPIEVTKYRFPNVIHFGDITKMDGKEIPPVDIFTSGSPCFPSGTLVLSKDGYVPIENIKVGDYVLTHKGRFKKVLNVGGRIAKTIIVKGNGHHGLETTHNHPFYVVTLVDGKLTEPQWIRADSIKGKYWATPLSELNTFDNFVPDFIEYGCAWGKVDSIIETNEEKQVYNIEVEEDNSYVVENKIVHNCQSLSQANANRTGFNDMSKSGLFLESVRLFKEMREKTNGKYPRFYVWENVLGAYTSNKGMDFKCVLESFTETEVPMPKSGKWSNAGMVRSEKCDICWRTLDSQFWGVPQKRKRIFLIADFGERDKRAPEVLFECENLSEYFRQSGTEGEEITSSPFGCLEVTDKVQQQPTPRKIKSFDGNVLSYDMGHPCDVVRNNGIGAVQTLLAGGGNNIPIVTLKDVVYNKEMTEPRFIRKLMPVECERVQGLPSVDGKGWTDIPHKSCRDTNRYKACGNGMAQPCPDFILGVVHKIVYGS